MKQNLSKSEFNILFSVLSRYQSQPLTVRNKNFKKKSHEKFSYNIYLLSINILNSVLHFRSHLGFFRGKNVNVYGYKIFI